MPSPTVHALALAALLFCGAVRAEPAAPILSDGIGTIDIADLRSELLGLPRATRNTLLKDKQRLARYIENVLLNRRIARAAEETEIPRSAMLAAEVKKARREAIVRLYTEQVFDAAEREIPGDDKLRPLALEHYRAHLGSYELPERRDYAHILIKVDPEQAEKAEDKARERAAELLAQLKAGADFGSLASAHSDDERSRKLGGRGMQPVARGQTVPPFDRVLFALKPGAMSDMVRTRFGYHIIKLLAIEPARTKSFEEVAPEILKTLKDQRMTEVRDKTLARFQGLKSIEVSDAFLAELNKAD